MYQEKIINIFKESIEIKERTISELVEEINEFAKIIINTYKNNKKVYICGNGGSTCDSMHFAEELVARFEKNRRALPALALSDSSTITCTANDFGFEEIFARQVEAFGDEGDLLIAISTSGNSENIIKAMNKAKEKNMKIVSLMGKNGGKMRGLGNLDLIVPSYNTARIQETHITIVHTMCKLIEEELFNEG